MNHTQEPMAGMGPYSSGLALLLFLSTWTITMTAMMLPSAGAMIMTYATVMQGRRSGKPAHAHTALFTLGYLLVWVSSGFAVYAIGALLPMITQTVPEFGKYSGLMGAAILIISGAYQFSSLKNICLSACLTPLGYILTH